jgi:uncharacterized membrane protein HdeD (DUF308 family)
MLFWYLWRESLWHTVDSIPQQKQHMEVILANESRIEVVTVIEGILIMIFGAALLLASPMLIIELLGVVFLITGVVVVIKGFFKKFRNP